MIQLKAKIQAVIIDLDGVITKTAAQHAKSWKIMFDLYNERRKNSKRPVFNPFDIAEDYPKYIDGIPRYDGVTQFLKSRGIVIPYGRPDDPAGKETICGLGNWKNSIYRKLIEKEGVEIFDKNIAQIKKWKEQGLKIAVISSSRNCKKILEITGLEHLFDARVDGVISAEKNIKGKPAPDIFLEAARELNVSPAQAVVVEDSLAGVEAGKKGGFALVVGVSNGSGKEELLQKGADVVVDDLQQLHLDMKTARPPEELPLALEHFNELKPEFEQKKLLLCLDFDGTLSPIVEHYENAAISEDMRNLVKQLSENHLIAVISGRGLNDVQQRVGVENIYYAGSHGFEISGPDDFYTEKEEARKTLPVFDELEVLLKKKTEDLEGIRFERKKFTLAIHYRQLAEKNEKEFFHRINKLLKNYHEVKATGGKKVVEIRPDIDWDKGKAVNMLIEKLSPEGAPLYPVYIGDDITDEDVFKSLDKGIGILVGEHGSKTYADYFLKDTEEVKIFLEQILSGVREKV